MLSESGHELLPKQYAWLSNALLKLLAAELGPDSVNALMKKLGERVASSMSARFTKTDSFPGRLGEIEKMMNELGYRARVRQSYLRKGAIVEATNCVYHSVAKEHLQLCNFDRIFLKIASGGLEVELQECIARGNPTCRFCLRKPMEG